MNDFCGRSDSVMDLSTPQVPGSRPDGYGTLSNELLTDYPHNSIIKLSIRWCVEGQGRISQFGLTQDIKMGR